MTQVSPARMSAEPSGSFSQSGVMVSGRSSSGRRPSGRMGADSTQRFAGMRDVVGEVARSRDASAAAMRCCCASGSSSAAPSIG